MENQLVKIGMDALTVLIPVRIQEELATKHDLAILLTD